MNWQFTLLDRNNVATIIDEPVGWDAMEIEIQRELDKHGVFFDFQGNEFKFYKEAAQIIREEYEQYGIESQITLIIKQQCGGGEFEELYRGKLMFVLYEFVCGDECYVSIPVETTNDVMLFANRFDQKVDLQTTKAFDETTVLPAYNKLPFDLELPSKAIFIQDKAETENDSVEVFDGGMQPVQIAIDPYPDTNITNSQIEFGLPDNQVSEIGNFGMNNTHIMDLASQNANISLIAHFPPSVNNPNINAFPGNGIWPLNLSPILNYAEGSPNYGDITNPVSFDIRLKGKLKVLETYLGTTTIYLLRLPDVPGDLTNGENESDYEFMAEYNIVDPGCSNIGCMLNPNSGDVNFDFIFNQGVTINKGDRFYLFMALIERKTQTEIDNVNNGAKALRLTLDPDSHVLITNVSKTEESITKAFMVNEAISRVCEAITNDRIRAYSNYFGRTDAQPYSSDQDGCGSLEALAKGIFVRNQENRIPGKPAVFALSMYDLWEGLNPIHNIGFGLEDDPNRPGYQWLRVEPWKYFYKQGIVMECIGINKVEKKLIQGDHYSTFKFGYEKWEGEEYSGLDEFLTKRIYRTTLTSLKNELVKLSKFIASGYALEITRRKNEDSKDWRFDNDTFIICCKRNGNSIVVELGNVLNPQNIIDPPSIYNFRISPIRNAMRWISKVFASYRLLPPGSKILFTDGDGNYFAEGEMQSNFCKLENQVLAENETIDTSLFSNILNALPILMPERIEFDFPMSIKDFKQIMQNRYGRIYYKSNCEEGYGWIDNIKYKPEEGLANFRLIPQYLI